MHERAEEPPGPGMSAIERPTVPDLLDVGQNSLDLLLFGLLRPTLGHNEGHVGDSRCLEQFPDRQLESEGRDRPGDDLTRCQGVTS